MLLFIVGCAVPEETQPATDSGSGDALVNQVGSDTEENAVLAEELADDLDAVVADLEGLDW